MYASNTLRLVNQEVFFGPGPRQLLQKIQQYSSLRKATIDTGISYTKALRMVKRMEQQLGFAVVESERGGNERGGTKLTPKGAQLLAAYSEIEQLVDTYAQELVKEKLGFLAERK